MKKLTCVILKITCATPLDVRSRTRFEGATEILWRQSEAYYGLGNYAQAAMLAQTALTFAGQLRLLKLSYLSATTLGQCYAKQNDLVSAKRTFLQAIDQIEKMRNLIAGTEEEVELFFEYQLAPYYALIHVLLKQGKPLDALLYAERAKSRVLLRRAEER